VFCGYTVYFLGGRVRRGPWEGPGPHSARVAVRARGCAAASSASPLQLDRDVALSRLEREVAWREARDSEASAVHEELAAALAAARAQAAAASLQASRAGAEVRAGAGEAAGWAARRSGARVETCGPAGVQVRACGLS
jgi:hypothetical protein